MQRQASELLCRQCWQVLSGDAWPEQPEGSLLASPTKSRAQRASAHHNPLMPRSVSAPKLPSMLLAAVALPTMEFAPALPRTLAPLPAKAWM